MSGTARHMDTLRQTSFITARGWLLLFVFSVVVLTLLELLSYTFFASDHYLSRARTEDVYFVYNDGRRLLRGENPYARIIGSDMRENQKYATYFPGPYLVSAALVATGREKFSEFHRLLRPWAVVCQWLGGLILLLAFMRRDRYALGLLIALFFVFNRYSIFVLRVVHIENFIIPMFLLSLLLVDRHHRGSYLLFGLTLAIKQMGIFLVPVYLLHAWKRSAASGNHLPSRLAFVLRESLWFAVPPVVVSIPFLMWNPKAFIMSVLFSATRASQGHVHLVTIDDVLGVEGLLARLPMLGLFAATYVVYTRSRLTFAAAAALVMAIFLGFNPVLFMQYIVWFIAPAVVVVMKLSDARSARPVDMPA